MDPVKGYDRVVRVCNSCHNVFSPRNSSTDSTQGAAETPSAEDQTYPADLLCQNQRFKLLPTDLLFNQSMRKEFYYERTPNTALCLSLADLLLSKRQAAGVILDCCHTVSAQLVPDSQGRVNEEVDHHFVIG